MGRFPVSCPLEYRKISSSDDSYQTLFTGPLGTNEMIAVNDQSRPAVSGPLGRQYSLDPMGPRAKLSLGDRNQPPSVGPVGRPGLFERPVDQVTESDFKLTTQTRSESGSGTVVTDSVIRTESDAQTDRANISMTNGPTDSNVISSSSDAVVHKLGGRLIQTKIVSESVAGRPVLVIQTKCEVQIDRSNGGVANGPTDPSVSPPSSDSGIHSLGEQWEIESAHLMSTGSTQTIKTFHSGAMNRDKDNPEENRKVTSFVRTRYGKSDSIDYYTSDGQNSDIAAMSDFSDDEDDEVQTDRVNIGVADGPTDSSVTPPSSDSGVHSLGEQWENMIANSMNTGSIQTVNTFNGSVVCQEDSKNQESQKMVLCSGTVCGKKDSMAYSTTDSQNSDIAAMSDFSDDEDESQGELRPKIRTECISEDSIKEGSINGERSDPNTNTVGVGSKTLDPDDKEYWTKFRLLTRQAFLLDNVKLSESDYPDAVKEVVTRSRLAIIEFNKGEDEPLEQYIEGEMSDDSDADSSINRYKSEYDHNLEDYRDWHYNRAPIVPNETADDVGGTIRNADYNDGQCQAGREEIEVGTDEHSEPGGRARSELTPEKTGRLIDTLDVNSVISDDITVTIRDSTGVSHRQDDEIRMVSMITVDVSQGHTKSQYSNSREIRDHVTPVSGEKQDSAAHGDIRLSGKYSIRNVTVVRSDGCDLTHRLNRAEIDWCGISVDRLIWGYHVSCLVAIVNRDRTIGRCMLMEGSGTYASTWGLEDRPTSVRRTHRLSRPKRLFPDSVTVGAPILTEQDPAELIGETVIDCRPPLLPVSIPLDGMSRPTISGARDCVQYLPPDETTKSIMNMDTNEITINNIVGFPWNDGGTDVEDELPTPVVSPSQIVVPDIPPAGTNDAFGRGESFDLELAKVICEVSVLPPLVMPLVEVVTSDCATVADYAPPAVPPMESVLEVPGCSMSDILGGSWMAGSATDFVGTNADEGGFLLSLQEPLKSLADTPPTRR